LDDDRRNLRTVDDERADAAEDEPSKRAGIARSHDDETVLDVGELSLDRLLDAAA
jgi:hypothetical protein